MDFTNCIVPVQLLWGAIAGAASSTSSLATTKSKLAGVPQDRHQVLPLAPPVGRFTLLPTGGGTGSSRRLEQSEDKPQVNMNGHSCWCGGHAVAYPTSYSLATSY